MGSSSYVQGQDTALDYSEINFHFLLSGMCGILNQLVKPGPGSMLYICIELLMQLFAYPAFRTLHNTSMHNTHSRFRFVWILVILPTNKKKKQFSFKKMELGVIFKNCHLVFTALHLLALCNQYIFVY